MWKIVSNAWFCATFSLQTALRTAQSRHWQSSQQPWIFLHRPSTALCAPCVNPTSLADSPRRGMHLSNRVV